MGLRCSSTNQMTTIRPINESITLASPSGNVGYRLKSFRFLCGTTVNPAFTEQPHETDMKETTPLVPIPLWSIFPKLWRAPWAAPRKAGWPYHIDPNNRPVFEGVMEVTHDGGTATLADRARARTGRR